MNVRNFKGVKLKTQNGNGLLCDDEVVKMERQNTREGYPGEKHGFSLCSRVRYNYLGPGTNIQARLERKDPPINDLDSFAKKHDTDYHNISREYKNNEITRPEFISKIKLADEKFKEKAIQSKDAPILGKIASKMILAKEIGEDIGLINRSKFSGGNIQNKPDKVIKPADRLKKKVQKELKKNNKKNIIEIKPDKENQQNQQNGGVLPMLAGAILSGLASTVLDKLINHFMENKKTGSGIPKTKKDKIQFLLDNVPEGLLLKTARRF